MAKNRIWSGTVSFGLVSIAVELVPATRSHRTGFHLLHARDHARVKRKMVCPEEDVVVHPEHTVLGYEFSPDHFVAVQESELEGLEPKRSRTIEILHFVDAGEMHPFHYDRPYYLVPSGDAKPFRLLTRALDESGKAGIAKFVLHAREHLVALRTINGALCLFTLHFASDLAPDEDLAAEAEPDKAQVKRMSAEMGGMSGPFDPGQHTDAYQKRVDALLAEKIRSGAVVEAPATDEEEDEDAEEPGQTDLVAALEESLAKTRDRKGK